jgi:hypothetical protein
MVCIMLDFITANTQLMSIIVIVFGGVFAFVKWLDTRNRELKDKHYSKYMDLIGIISGIRPDGTVPRITEQIAAIWFLREYKGYNKVTYKIFSALDLDKIANETWTKHVAPEVRLLLQEIEPH